VVTPRPRLTGGDCALLVCCGIVFGFLAVVLLSAWMEPCPAAEPNLSKCQERGD